MAPGSAGRSLAARMASWCLPSFRKTGARHAYARCRRCRNPWVHPFTNGGLDRLLPRSSDRECDGEWKAGWNSTRRLEAASWPGCLEKVRVRRALKSASVDTIVEGLSVFPQHKMNALASRNGDGKEFLSHAPGYWPDTAPELWNDWKWQLKNRVTSLAQLEQHVDLREEERSGVLLSGDKLALAITPHFFNLIPRGKNPDDPIRRQVIPRIEETWASPYDMTDPCGEDSHMPVPGLVHRYPDRVLFLVTDRCAAYCRYCTRSRLVSNASGYDFHPEYDKQIEYIAQHPEIRDVLLSGGDPLLLSDDKLEHLLRQLRAIPHVEFLRIGTRIPIFLPQRITPQLCAMLKKYHPLFISIHSNHPRELTTEVRDALGRLADAGIPLGNQSVLLRNVNDSVEVAKAHVQKLLMCRVKPYYLYQCDLISGSAHLRAR